ncbi:MAG: ribonuclease III [Phycisphaerae bacterium]
MDQAAIESCQQLIGYTFGDPELLSLALTHSSVAATRVQSNERLEFLGDSVLALVVCHELFCRDGGLQEGEMTKIKSSVVSRTTCATVSETIGLSQTISMGKGMSKPGGLPTSVAAALYEAVVGAIYIDGGLEPARTFILRHMLPHIEEALANEHQRNFKSVLQQHAQREWNITPEYQMLDEKGPDHDKCFEVAVAVAGRQFPSAWGKNKKEAEQEAAHRALIELGIVKED